MLATEIAVPIGSGYAVIHEEVAAGHEPTTSGPMRSAPTFPTPSGVRAPGRGQLDHVSHAARTSNDPHS